MNTQWNLKPTNNLNRLLRVRNNIVTQTLKEEYPHLLILQHNFHMADDIQFPDPACLSFFLSFEENHLNALEEEGKLVVVAVDIFEGVLQFLMYCKDPQQSVYDCIAYLKSNTLYACSFEIITNDNGQKWMQLY